MYNPILKAFFGQQKRSTVIYNNLPTFITLFVLFWIPVILNNIFNEINRYATILDILGIPKEGQNYEPLTIRGLKAYMAIALCMRMKKNPNYKT